MCKSCCPPSSRSPRFLNLNLVPFLRPGFTSISQTVSRRFFLFLTFIFLCVPLNSSSRVTGRCFSTTLFSEIGGGVRGLGVYHVSLMGPEAPNISSKPSVPPKPAWLRRNSADIESGLENEKPPSDSEVRISGTEGIPMVFIPPFEIESVGRNVSSVESDASDPVELGIRPDFSSQSSSSPELFLDSDFLLYLGRVS